MELNNCRIAIIGLGYVGLPLAVEFGRKYPTIGFDINKDRVNELSIGNDLTLEVTTEDIQNSTHLKFTSKKEEIDKCQIYIITVPTPIDEAKRPNLTPLKNATMLVAKSLNKGDYIIFESTVFPGCTEEICVPILEDNSGLKFNKDFFCGYSPERVNPGDKINTLTKIKKITSGSSIEASNVIDNLYKSIIDAGTYMASSIKVIFGRLEIDTLEVLEAAGSKWNFLPFRPGLVGGHCIGVDPYYLTHKAEQVGYNPQLILAGRRINDNMAIYMVKKFVQKMIQNDINISKSTVGVLGITFKENCPDIRNSKIFDVIRELKTWGAKVIVVDPWANSQELDEHYDIRLGDLENNQFDSLLVAVGHKEFRDLTSDELRGYCKGSNPVLADVKSIYDKNLLTKEGFSVFRL